MITLPNILAAWETPGFDSTFADTVQTLDIALLLQQALAHSSYVSDSPAKIVILHTEATPTLLLVKAGVFYTGVIAGSCCADDPTPMCEQQEYCELQFVIDRQTAATQITLLTEPP